MPRVRSIPIDSAGRQALVLLTLALASLCGAWFLDHRPSLDDEAWLSEVREAYGSLCADMAKAAEEGASSFAKSGGDPPARLATFDLLRGIVDRERFRHKTLLLFNPDGNPVAWAGDGLLHTIKGEDLPRQGFSHINSYSAASLFAVQPLGVGNRPWRMVAGQSFATDALPFRAPDRPFRRRHQWSLGAGPAGVEDHILEVELEGRPSLFVNRRGKPLPGPRPAEWLARWSVALLGASLFILSLHWLVDPATGLFGRSPRRGLGLSLLASIAASALALSLGAKGGAVALLAAGAAAAMWSLAGGFRLRPVSFPVVGAGLATLALVGLGWWIQGSDLLLDLGRGLLLEKGDHAYRLGFCLLSMGLLSALLRQGDGELSDRPPENLGRQRWIAACLLIAAACLHDFPGVAIPLLTLGGSWVAFAWARGRELRTRPVPAGALFLLFLLLGATAWEIGYRSRFRQVSEEYYLPRVSAPSQNELGELHTEILAFFDHRQVDDLVPSPFSSFESKDLAFRLWRSSPMADRDGFSALVVEPLNGAVANFSFGIPLDADLYPDAGASFYENDVPVWQDAMIEGVADLTLQGRPWGQVRYHFLPRLGFRLAVEEKDDLQRKLLRGNAYRREVDGLPRNLHLAVHGTDGRVRISPWDKAAPSLSQLGERGEGQVATPSGRSWFWVREGADLIEVLYLPMLLPLQAVERVATHALGALILIAIILLFALLFALPRAAFRSFLLRSWRSYSKRLILVYTVLLFVPLVALNLVLLRGFEAWMRGEQMNDAEKGAEAAQLLLSSYIQNLPLGFDLRSQLGREVLTRVSEILQHESNLYWQGQLVASSQQELFTSGLLPKRIPGEIYADMVLRQQPLGVRSQHSGELAYLEVYRPLRFDTSRAEDQLFVSVPLVQQEADAAREVATMRRRAVLFSTGLFLALLGVGSRLAGSFTKPIRQLVTGTERIAAGASSLEVAPKELELAALAQAIDSMAGSLARGRERLLSEKEVVERMVANIASGVVSVDHGGRVLMQNRVAADLLGTRMGESLEEELGANPRLKPVADFLSGSGTQARRASVQLSDEEGEGEDWSLTWVPIPGSQDPAALLVLDDVSEVLRGQRLEAWVEMARIIAHEIKNPLTPIRLSTEHLREVFSRDPERAGEVFERCTDNILRQVEVLRQTASEFSTYSRIPRAELEEGDLVAALAEISEAYRDAELEGIVCEFQAPDGELRAPFDPRLLARAIRNLLENALRASRSVEGRGRVELSVEEVFEEHGEGQFPWAQIRVRDSGPGVEEGHLGRIFEPYFSTHESGTGLGLAITRRIVEEHSGKISARNRPEGGLEVLITIPMSRRTTGSKREEWGQR